MGVVVPNIRRSCVIGDGVLLTNDCGVWVRVGGQCAQPRMYVIYSAQSDAMVGVTNNNAGVTTNNAGG